MSEEEPKLSRTVSNISEADSVASEDLEQLLDVKERHEQAPNDIYHVVDGEKVRVLKAGEQVPVVTKYKKYKSQTALVKFRVSEFLEVTIIKTLDMGTPDKQTPNKQTPNEQTPNELQEIDISSPAQDETPPSRGSGNLKRRRLVSGDLGGGGDDDKDNEPGNGGVYFRSYQDWVAYVELNFEEIICGGLDVVLRGKTRENIKKGAKLTPRQNAGVINSLNFAIMCQYGNQTPEPSLCRLLAQLLKKKIPDTFAVVETVRSEQYGDLPVQKKKGEGGTATLEKRISSNFYNKFQRNDVTKAASGDVESREDLLDFSAKKRKKCYGLSTERWYLGSKVSAEEFKESEENFGKIASEDDGDKKKKLLNSSRVFLAVKFRTCDPAAHFLGLQSFWEMPFGPDLLSNHFEWASIEGSRDGSLKKTIEKNTTSTFNLVVRYLADKKGEIWAKKYDEVYQNSRAHFGNSILARVFLLRELAKSWKNSPEKLVFIEGEDDLSKVSNQPFIHVLKVNQTGEGDYDERVCISVRIGTTLIFNDVSLTGALASVIELAFVFNLMFPKDADDIFQFVQRILANYGPADGARNSMGKVKRPFVDFQCAVGQMVVDSDKGEVRKMPQSKPVKNPVKKVKRVPSFGVKQYHELSPMEKIREDNINERMALLKKLGFCQEDSSAKMKPKKKRVKVPQPVAIRKSDRLNKYNV